MSRNYNERHSQHRFQSLGGDRIVKKPVRLDTDKGNGTRLTSPTPTFLEALPDECARKLSTKASAVTRKMPVDATSFIAFRQVALL